jgi:threonine dehydrogenase-like Zn-dependent dehydrogenase
VRGTVLYAPGDVRVEQRDDPKIVGPTDAILRLPATCVCGSDLWPYRGPAPVRRFLPELIDLVCNRRIDPGRVFDLSLPLEQAAEGYRAMDQRRAIKVLLRP